MSLDFPHLKALRVLYTAIDPKLPEVDNRLKAIPILASMALYASGISSGSGSSKSSSGGSSSSSG